MNPSPNYARDYVTSTLEHFDAPGLRRAFLPIGAAALALVVSACTASGASRVDSTQTVGGVTTTTVVRTTVPHQSQRTPKPKPTSTTSGPATVGPVNVPLPPATTFPPAVSGAVTFVGDSVGVDATPYLQQDIPGIVTNAMVDRSWQAGETITQSLAAEGALSPVVVIELGLNGPIGAADFQAMMSTLANAKRVVFLNIRLPVGAYGPGTDWWGNENNSVLASEVPRYPNAVLADWYSLSNSHTDWFAPDGIHLDPPGAAAMAALVKEYI